jgi:hypothetical protein
MQHALMQDMQLPPLIHTPCLSCTYTHSYMYTRVLNISPRVYTCIRVHVYTCTRVYVYTCIRVHVYTCTREYLYTCIRVHVSIHDPYTRVYMYTLPLHVYTCTCIHDTYICTRYNCVFGIPPTLLRGRQGTGPTQTQGTMVPWVYRVQGVAPSQTQPFVDPYGGSM